MSEMTGKDTIIAQVEQLIQPLLAAHGAELVDLEFNRPRRGRATLRLFVDRPGGITLEELTRLSRVVGDLLDVREVIEVPYNLEVSSPGLTRPLKKPADFQRYTGRLVRLTTRSPYQGRQVHRGILRGLEDDQVCLQAERALVKIPLEDIAKARLDIDLKNFGKEA